MIYICESSSLKAYLYNSSDYMGDTSFLNVTLLSAQGLKDVCAFGTMSPYAKAWIDPSMKQRTPVAPSAGCTPVWGHKLSLPLPPNALKNKDLRLYIQVMNQGTATDTIVGIATIPLGDLIHNTTPNGLEFMAVQLQRPSGRVQGLVNFSVEIADESLKYEESSTSSSAKSKYFQNLRDKFLRANVQLPTDTVGMKGPSVDSITVTARRERLLGGQEPPAAPDALGSGHNAGSRPEFVRKPLQIDQLSVAKNERALDLLGQSKRRNSIGSPAFSPLVTGPTAASTGIAGTVALDALDRSKQGTVCRHQGNANNCVDSPLYGSMGRGTDDNGSTATSFAHTMFGDVLGSILMGDAVSDSKGSMQHGGDRGHDDPGTGDNPSAHFPNVET